MAKEGFRLIHLRHFSLEQNPYGWIHSALNRLPFPQDALYSFLKSASPPSIPERRSWREPWVLGKVLLLSVGLLPTALLFSSLMGWLHQGATLEAYFEKEG